MNLCDELKDAIEIATDPYPPSGTSETVAIVLFDSTCESCMFAHSKIAVINLCGRGGRKGGTYGHRENISEGRRLCHELDKGIRFRV